MIALRFWGLPCTAILLFGSFPVAAQGPDIGRNGVFNAASAIPLVLAKGEIARGGLIAVTGIRLGRDPAGTTARLSGPWGNVALPVISVTPARMETRVPVSAPLGPASLTVTVAGQSSRAVPVRVVASQIGLFSRQGNGAGQGAIENLSPSGARTANSVSRSAMPGQTVALTGTGLGSTTAPGVFIGGRRAALVSLRKGTTGAKPDEMVVRIRADAPEGCFVPVQVRNTGSIASNTVTLAIHRGGGACVPLGGNPFGTWAGSRFGFVAVARSVFRGLDAPAETTTDEAGGSFARLPPVTEMPLFFLPPPAGTCVSQVEAAGESLPRVNPFLDLLLSSVSKGALAAGRELLINDGQIQQKIPPVEGAPGAYYTRFSDRPGGATRVLRNFAGPSQLHISGGGNEVGPFRLTLPGPEPFTVTSAPSSIDRAGGVTLRWERMGADRFAIAVLIFADPVTFTSGTCYCTAAPGATSLTIPPEALAHFPAVAPAYGGAQSFLTLTSWPVNPVAFTTTGVDHGLGVSVFTRNWEVTLR